MINLQTAAKVIRSRRLGFKPGAHRHCPKLSQNHASSIDSLLTKITWQDGTSRQYLYEGYNLLTGIIDETGTRIGTFSYHPDGKVASSELANGAEKLTFSYSPLSTQITTAATGKTVTQSYSTAQGTIRPTTTSAANPLCGNTAADTQYDANGNVTRRKEFDGTITRYVYDDNNREIHRVTAAGTTSAKHYLTRWHPTWNLPKLRIEPLKITAYHYDERGNLTGQAETATTDASGSAGANAVRDISRPINRIGYAYDTNNLAIATVNITETMNPANFWVSEVTEKYTIAYNSLGEILSVIAKSNKAKTRTLSVDKHGNYVQIQAPDLSVVTMQFDSRNSLIKFQGKGENFNLERNLTGAIVSIKNLNKSTGKFFLSSNKIMKKEGSLSGVLGLPDGDGLPGDFSLPSNYNPMNPSFWFGWPSALGDIASKSAASINGAVGVNILPTNKCEAKCWAEARVLCGAEGLAIGSLTKSPVVPIASLICGIELTKQCYKVAQCSPCSN